MKRLIAIALVAVALTACSTLDGYKEQRSLLMNPQRANETPDNKISNMAPRQLAAQEIMVKNYYLAMAKAQPNYNADPPVIASTQAIANYIGEGVALNTAFCRRWFHRIDDSARQFQWTGRDLNIITALGTTALGLLDASAKTVSVYGALSTAAAGFGDNFNSALLTAPSQKNVEGKVMSMLASYGKQLKAEAPALSFAEAYTRLETHADICTFASIRDVVNSSLTQTETTVAASGSIITAPSPAAVASAPALTANFSKDNAGDRIIAWWIPGNVVNVERESKLMDWMMAHGVNTSVPFFAHAEIYDAARRKAVAELAIPEVSK